MRVTFGGAPPEGMGQSNPLAAPGTLPYLPMTRACYVPLGPAAPHAPPPAPEIQEAPRLPVPKPIYNITYQDNNNRLVVPTTVVEDTKDGFPIQPLLVPPLAERREGYQPNGSP